jgi:hypothetical protein
MGNIQLLSFPHEQYPLMKSMGMERTQRVMRFWSTEHALPSTFRRKMTNKPIFGKNSGKHTKSY